MDYRFIAGDVAQAQAELLFVPLFEGEQPERVDRALKGLLWKAASEEGFRGKPDQVFVFHTHGKIKADRVLLLGMGSRARFEPEALRLAAGRGARMASKLRVRRAAFALPKTEDPDAAVKAAVEGLSLGAYRFDRYRTTNTEETRAPRLAAIDLHLPQGTTAGRGLQAMVTIGAAVAEATNWARDLVNEPAAVVTPERLAEEARSLQRVGLDVSVSGRKEIQRLRMGLFLGVAQGSVLEPKLIHVRYTPKGPKAAKQRPLALVGKAITFDSGGLSLKTADGMVDMKTDMAGSAAVLAAMRVIAQLKPPFPVHALIGACENMP
jgi:leucyl aminopeptidase